MPKIPASSESPAGWSRLRRGGMWLLISCVLIIPKTLALRRRRDVWNLLRIIVAAAGVILIIRASLGYGHALQVAIALLFLLFALAVRPERPAISVDRHARDIGAVIVLDGGQCRADNGILYRSYIYVGSERIWAADPTHRHLLEIPYSELADVRVEAEEMRCTLRLTNRNSHKPAAEFFYTGFFAEHLARVAETTLQSRLHRDLPILR